LRRTALGTAMIQTLALLISLVTVDHKDDKLFMACRVLSHDQSQFIEDNHYVWQWDYLVELPSNIKFNIVHNSDEQIVLVGFTKDAGFYPSSAGVAIIVVEKTSGRMSKAVVFTDKPRMSFLGECQIQGDEGKMKG
jgi:hypothetical protein